MAKDLTKGSVPKLLLVFAAPLFVSNALQAIYNIVDMIVVGQVIGGNGMSAVATGGNVLSILNFVVMGFAGAGQIIIARNVGQKDMDAVKKTIGTMFTLLLSAAIMRGMGDSKRPFMFVATITVALPRFNTFLQEVIFAR